MGGEEEEEEEGVLDQTLNHATLTNALIGRAAPTLLHDF